MWSWLHALAQWDLTLARPRCGQMTSHTNEPLPRPISSWKPPPCGLLQRRGELRTSLFRDDEETSFLLRDCDFSCAIRPWRRQRRPIFLADTRTQFHFPTTSFAPTQVSIKVIPLRAGPVSSSYFFHIFNVTQLVSLSVPQYDNALPVFLL